MSFRRSPLECTTAGILVLLLAAPSATAAEHRHEPDPVDERVYYLLVGAEFLQYDSGFKTAGVVGVFEETNGVAGLQRSGPEPDTMHFLHGDGAGCSTQTCPSLFVPSFDEEQVVTVHSPVPLF